MSLDQFEEAKETNQKWKYSNERTSESWRKVEATAMGSSHACKRSSRKLRKSLLLMIVHVLSGWLASSCPIRLAWRNGSIAAWMFVHPTNTAVILHLKGFLINQKLFLSTSEYQYYYQGRKWSMPDFWNRHNHSLPKVYRFIWSCPVFFY